MPKNRVDRTKVLIGGAIKRKNPSKAATVFEQLHILSDDTLDYGCGYGFDADHYKWAKYDPYYFDNYPSAQFKNIVCINVLNVVSSKIRTEIIGNIQELLKPDGTAYLVCPRNIPVCGKYSNFERRPQNYVVLTLNTTYKDQNMEIYELKKQSVYQDKTHNIGE